MHRSVSANRIWDGHFSYHSSSKASAAEDGELPKYDPFSDAAKKEKAGAKFAGNAIHAIPFVLLFCAFLLWFFSNPDVELNENPLVAKIQGQTIEADLDSDGINTGHLPLDLRDLDSTYDLLEHSLTASI